MKYEYEKRIIPTIRQLLDTGAVLIKESKLETIQALAAVGIMRAD